MPLDRSDRQALQSEPDELTGEELERSETPDTTTTRRGYAKAGIAALTAGLAGCSGGGGNNNPTSTPTDTPSGDTTLADTATATPENNESPGRNLYEEHPEMFVHYDDIRFTRNYAAVENQRFLDAGATKPGGWGILLETLTSGLVNFDEIERQIQGGENARQQELNYIALKPTDSEKTWNKITENSEEISDGIHRLDTKHPNGLDTVSHEYNDWIMLHGKINIDENQKPDASGMPEEWISRKENGQTIRNSRPDVWSLTEKSRLGKDAETSSIMYARPEKKKLMALGEFDTNYQAFLQEENLAEDMVEIKRWVLGPDGNITDENVGFNGENPLERGYTEANYR